MWWLLQETVTKCFNLMQEMVRIEANESTFDYDTGILSRVTPLSMLERNITRRRIWLSLCKKQIQFFLLFYFFPSNSGGMKEVEGKKWKIGGSYDFLSPKSEPTDRTKMPCFGLYCWQILRSTECHLPQVLFHSLT